MTEEARQPKYPRRPNRWIKLWVNECLRGSIRFELQADERCVWYELLLMARESRTPGIIQATPGVPYPLTWVAHTLNITEELLERTLQRCQMTDRIALNGGSIQIVNWEKYQGASGPDGAGAEEGFVDKPKISKAQQRRNEMAIEKMRRKDEGLCEYCGSAGHASEKCENAESKRYVF